MFKEQEQLAGIMRQVPSEFVAAARAIAEMAAAAQTQHGAAQRIGCKRGRRHTKKPAAAG